MQGKLVQLRAAAVEQLPLMLAVNQDLGGLRRQHQLVVDTLREFVQGGGNIADQLDVRGIVALFVSRQYIDMHQRGVAVIPHGRFVLHRAIADADDQVGEMQESIPRLVIEQPNPPGKAGKVVLIHRAGGLIGAGNRDMAFFQQFTQRRAVFRLAGHQAEQEYRIFSAGNHLRDSLNGFVRRRAGLRRIAGGQNPGVDRPVDHVLRQADEGAAGASLLGCAKRVGNHFRQRFRGGDFHRVFGYRTKHRHRIHTLVHLFGLVGAFYRTAQRHHRVAFAVCGGHAGNQVRAAGAGRDQRDARFPGDAANRGGHKRGVGFVAYRNNANGGVQQRIEDFIDFGPWNAEHLLYALRLKLADDKVGAVRPLARLMLIIHENLLSFRLSEWRHQDCQDADPPAGRRYRQEGQSSICGSHQRSARRGRADNRADGRRPGGHR